MILSVPAPPPFDHLDADVILRSSDEEPVDFRTFKLLLTLASPFFSELFTLPQSDSLAVYTDDAEGVRGIPVVQMTEDKDTLRSLLVLCTPIAVVQPTRFTSLPEVQKVIEASVKYEMEQLQQYLKQQLVGAQFIESQPIRVFAIAYRYGWDTEARKAARYTLRHNLNVGFFPELEYISGATYFRLQEYHRMCAEVASSRALLQPAIMEKEDMWTWITCKRCPGSASSLSSRMNLSNAVGFPLPSFLYGDEYPDARRWWTTWIKKIAAELRVRPWGETVRKWDVMKTALVQADACPNCSKKAREDLETYTQMLAVDIEKDIAGVSTRSHLSFCGAL